MSASDLTARLRERAAKWRRLAEELKAIDGYGTNYLAQRDVARLHTCADEVEAALAGRPQKECEVPHACPQCGASWIGYPPKESERRSATDAPIPPDAQTTQGTSATDRRRHDSQARLANAGSDDSRGRADAEVAGALAGRPEPPHDPQEIGWSDTQQIIDAIQHFGPKLPERVREAIEMRNAALRAGRPEPPPVIYGACPKCGHLYPAPTDGAENVICGKCGWFNPLSRGHVCHACDGTGITAD